MTAAVSPVTPLPGDRFVRELPSSPRALAEERGNRAVLEPERYLCLSDVPEYGLTQYGTVPEIDRAVEEIVAATPTLPEATADAPGLSPLARVLLAALIATNRHAPMPYLEAQETRALARPESGLVDETMRRLAERAAENGNLTARSLAERYGDAGAEIFAAWRRAVPRRRGLQWLMRRASLPIVPRDLAPPPTRAEVDASAREDPVLLDRMVEESSIPPCMPLIATAAELVADRVFTGFHAVCAQHVLGTQVGLFDTLAAKGLDPRKTEIIGAPYSTSFVTEHALRQRGFTVQTPALGDELDVEAVVDAAMRAAVARAVERAGPDELLLVMDDGGKATRCIHREHATEAHRFRVVEQTTRGITEVAALDPCRVPVVDVARSQLKRHESPKIGEEVAAAVEELLARLSMPEVEGRPCLVVGFGMIGSGVAERLAARGARVSVWDIAHERRAEAEQRGHEVASQWPEALAGKHVVVGCTGKRVLGRDEMALLDHETVLASASSRNIEIDMRIGRDDDVLSRVVAVDGPGDDRYFTWVWRLGDRDVVVLRNGFPLNFNGAIETGTPESIQQTRAIMLLGAAQAATTSEPGLHRLAPRMQEELVRRAGGMT